MQIAEAVNRMLRHQMAICFLPDGGVHPFRGVLFDLVQAVGQIPDPATVPDYFTPPLGDADLAPPEEAAKALIDHVKQATEGALSDVDIGTPVPLQPAPGPNSVPPVIPAFTSARLILEVTRLKAVQVTPPVGYEDEITLTGGYSYKGGYGKFSELSNDFSNGEDYKVPAAGGRRVLRWVPLQTGRSEFMGTIILTEDDMFKPEVASALGVVVSLVLTAGVAAAISYATAAGLPANLEPHARDVLVKHGITGTRSWFESLLGPETFEIVTLQTDIDWTPGQPIRWSSWIPNAPFAVATNPPTLEGEGTEVGKTVSVAQAEIENAADGTRYVFVTNGGTYEFDLQVSVSLKA